MSEQENKQELRGKLIRAKDIEEVRAILGPETTEEEIDRVWQEIEAHRPAEGLEEIDDDELDAVSGGADRDWEKEGCSATVEEGSWCGSDDDCYYWDVTYCNVDRCTDGNKHEWDLYRYEYEYDPMVSRQGGELVHRIYRCRKCEKTKEDRVMVFYHRR